MHPAVLAYEALGRDRDRNDSREIPELIFERTLNTLDPVRMLLYESLPCAY